MRTTMRRGTFETNSSSVHTLILIPYDLADRWREMGDDYWIDMSAVEKDAEESGSGYGDIDGVQAPANEGHLTSRSAREMLGEWREPGMYEDDVYANWMLPLSVIDNPDRWVNNKWSWIENIDESDEGYVVLVG